MQFGRCHLAFQPQAVWEECARNDPIHVSLMVSDDTLEIARSAFRESAALTEPQVAEFGVNPGGDRVDSAIRRLVPIPRTVPGVTGTKPSDVYARVDRRCHHFQD